VPTYILTANNILIFRSDGGLLGVSVMRWHKSAKLLYVERG